MIGTIVAAVVGLLLLVLLLPVGYRFSIKKWEFSIQVIVLLGIWKKKLTFDFADDDEEEELDASVMEDMVRKAEAAHQKQAEHSEEETNHQDGAKYFLGSLEEEDDTDHPSHGEQFRFALHNGLVEKVFGAVSDCISHGWPKRWTIEGEFGTGDPMETGLLCGMTAAFFQKETSGIVWNYLDKVIHVTGGGRGRIIPLYLLYIVLKLIISKEARQFWHFRQGGTHHE